MMMVSRRDTPVRDVLKNIIKKIPYIIILIIFVEKTNRSNVINAVSNVAGKIVSKDISIRCTKK